MNGTEALKTILVVEDDLRMQAMMRDLLGTICGNIELCGDGAQAVTRYDELRPEAVVMDIRLPGLDGLEATERIMQRHPSACIYIVTAYNEPRYRDRAASCGAHGFFLKDDLSLLYDALSDLQASEPDG
jgi:CheY-like chemotaxis protein